MSSLTGVTQTTIKSLPTSPTTPTPNDKMIIGIPKEIKDKEYRVAMVPAGVKVLTSKGHRVLVESTSGSGVHITDKEFEDAGARIIQSAEEVYKESEMIVKVKEPLPSEYPYLHDGHILFTFLHLAPNRELTDVLIKQGVSSIGYETVELPDGTTPLLRPMSEVAGKLSVQFGAEYLKRQYNGRGILLGGVTGIEPGRVLILGGGTVGTSALKIAVGFGADTTIVDINPARLKEIEEDFKGQVTTFLSTRDKIEAAALKADVLIGAVHSPGRKTPTLITKEIVSRMKKGSVIVDVAVDQGGCVETIHPTTHSAPIYEVDGVIHYGVSNMPGAVPRTSTFALTNATLPYIAQLASLGLSGAIKDLPELLPGLNTHKGHVVNKDVADSLELPYTDAGALL